MSKQAMRYEVNANGNRTFSATNKAAVMRVWRAWNRIGAAPHAYHITVGEHGVECRRIA